MVGSPVSTVQTEIKTGARWHNAQAGTDRQN